MNTRERIKPSRSIVKINHRSVYAPVRFEATRPYAKRIGRMIASRFTQDDTARFKFLKNELAPIISREMDALGQPEDAASRQFEFSNIQVFGAFYRSNRIVFDLHKALCCALLSTDITDIPCAAFSMPAESVYLHFGQSCDLSNGIKNIEGAFLTLYSFPTGRRLGIDLVPAKTFDANEFWAAPFGDQLISILIELEDDKTMLNALQRSLADTIERNKAGMAEAEKLELEILKTYGEVVKLPWPGENLVEYQPLLERALTLIVNSIFYLAAIPEDLVNEWEVDTPPQLLTLISSSKQGARRTGETSADNRGYIKVNYLGRKFAAKCESVGFDNREGNTQISPHIRRGHFRHQRYGIDNLKIKLIFIAPVFVNAGLGEMLGRIYDIPTPASQQL
jgi:hypothetical protein